MSLYSPNCPNWQETELLTQLQSHQKYFDSANNVHGRGDGGAQVEEYTHGAAKLGTQISRNHEVGAATRNNAVGRNCGHADGREESLQAERTHKAVKRRSDE